MDYTLEDTIHLMFTTRVFSTGAPGTLAGTPVVSAYEADSATQITAGITLGVDHDSVTGLNLLTIVATAANGYENGKDYNLVITTGTVSSVSVVGEVIGTFSIGRSAAAVDLANGTDGLSALKALIDTVDTVVDGIQTDLSNATDGLGAIKATADAIETDTQDLQTQIGTAGAGLSDLGGMSTAMKAEVNAEADTALTDYDALVPADLPANFAALSISVGGAIDNVTLVATTTTNTDMRGTDSAATATALATAQTDLDTITGVGGVNLLPATQASIDAIETDTGTTLPATLSTIAGYIDTEVAAILVDTGTTIPALIATAQADLDTITGADGVNLLSATQASIDAIEADTNELQGDWVNGGRLDLLLDAIPTTAMRGTDNAALASVCTEARLAELDAANLPTDIDAILVDTGTTIPGTITTLQADATAIVADTNELQTDWADGGRLDLILDTAAAGSGGDATEAKQDTILANLATVDGVVDSILVDTGTTIPATITTVDTVVDGIQTDLDNATDGLGAIKTAVDAINTGSGSGARTVTITVDDGTTAIENARVRYTEGGNTYTADTDASGNATMNLDDATYTVAIYKPGYTFAGTTNAVAGDESVTHSMTAIPAAGTPSDPTLCRITADLIDLNGVAMSGITIDFELIGAKATKDGTLLIGKRKFSATTNASGQLEDKSGNAYLDLVRTDAMTPAGSYYRVISPELRFRQKPVTKLELEASTYNLKTLIT